MEIKNKLLHTNLTSMLPYNQIIFRTGEEVTMGQEDKIIPGINQRLEGRALESYLSQQIQDTKYVADRLSGVDQLYEVWESINNANELYKSWIEGRDGLKYEGINEDEFDDIIIFRFMKLTEVLSEIGIESRERIIQRYKVRLESTLEHAKSLSAPKIIIDMYRERLLKFKTDPFVTMLRAITKQDLDKSIGRDW